MVKPPLLGPFESEKPVLKPRFLLIRDRRLLSGDLKAENEVEQRHVFLTDPGNQGIIDSGHDHRVKEVLIDSELLLLGLPVG